MEEYSSSLEPTTSRRLDATEPRIDRVKANCSLDGERIEGKRKKKKRKKRYHPVTRKARDQTSLMNDDLTIVNFLTAIGEPISGRLQNGNIERYMDRTILQLSFVWSRSAVLGLRMNNRGGYESGCCYLSKRLGILIATLSTDCARAEVEAMSLLASFDSASGNAPCQEQWNDEDDDGMTDEISALDHFTVSLREELSLICSLPECCSDDGITSEISALEDATAILREELSSIHSLPTEEFDCCLEDGRDEDGGSGYSVNIQKVSSSAKAPTKRSPNADLTTIDTMSTIEAMTTNTNGTIIERYTDQLEEIGELNAKVCMREVAPRMSQRVIPILGRHLSRRAS